MPFWTEFFFTLLTLITLVFLPGVTLSYWLFSGKRLDIFERIPLGFGVMCGMIAGLFVAARIFGRGWRPLIAVWIALILGIAGAMIVWRINPRLRDRVARFASRLNDALPRMPTGETPAASPILVALSILVLIVGVYLTHIGPTDVDDWGYFSLVRKFADGPIFTPVSLSDREVAHPWWLIHAAVVRVFDVDVVRLGQDWMPAIFVPVSLMAFYALARALFLNRNLAIGATLFQFAFLIIDLFNPLQYVWMPGQWFFTRIDQDHTIALFLFLPVFATLLIWYLREGGWVLLGALLIAFFGLIATHALLGIVLGAFTLIPVLGIELIYAPQSPNRNRLIALGIATLIIFGALTPALPNIFTPRDTYLAPWRMIENNTREFPFSVYRYTFYSPTIYSLRVDFLGQAPALAAILLLPFLIPALKKDLTARFLFITSVGLLTILYLPPIFQLFTIPMNETVLRLWLWNPKTLVIAYFLPHGFILAREGWRAIRQRAWNYHSASLVALSGVVIGLIAIAPLSLRDDLPPEWGKGHALPDESFEMLRAVRARTTPGERAIIFSEIDLASAIPAYRADLSSLLYRADPNGDLAHGAIKFFDATFITSAHLDFLNAYPITYLIVHGDQELISQCDLLPRYFTALDRNSYGALYRVATPLKVNDLIEANTVTETGEWQSAIQAYNAILATDPNNSLAHTGLGIILRLSGKPQAAARELELAVAAAPQNAQAHAHLVYVYRQLGMTDQATKHLPGAGRLVEK